MNVRHPNRQAHKDKEESKLKTQKDKIYTKEPGSTTPQEIYGVLTKDMLKELASFRSDCCITIILPTHRAGMEVNEQQDVILFKNVLQDVKKQLEEKGTDAVKIEKILGPAFELLRDDTFWHNQGNGLAIFLADGYFRYIKLPFVPEQECIINNTFYLINLLQLLNTNAKDEFYLLLIRRERTKLYKADAYGLHEVTTENMPDNINSVINYEENGKEFMETDAGENSDAPEFIAAGRPEKIIIKTYVEKIDRAFQQQAPGNSNWPLMLAGQDDLLEAFRNASQYKNVMDTELSVTNEHAESRTLFEQARQKINDRQEQERNEHLDTYMNNIITDLTSSMPEKVIPATYYSQVRTLFVEKGAHIWGHFDDQNNKLVMHASREDGDDCLIEKAAIQTILHGGEVYITEKDKMPKGAVIAALLRF